MHLWFSLQKPFWFCHADKFFKFRVNLTGWRGLGFPLWILIKLHCLNSQDYSRKILGIQILIHTYFETWYVVHMYVHIFSLYFFIARLFMIQWNCGDFEIHVRYELLIIERILRLKISCNVWIRISKSDNIQGQSQKIDWK